jgi:hypothetical protein
MDELSQRRLAKNKADADAALAKALGAITEKSPGDVTEEDAAFLRARRSYLTEEQRAVFADALNGAEPAEAAEAPADEQPVEAAPKKKGK